MKEKGIDDAVEAVKYINDKYGRTCYALDIYGQVDSNQTEWFNEIKKSFPDYIKYCGTVEFDKSTEVLKNYYALLFPTYYAGEGFAGTLIDAFSAGVPVIASDWKYNAEIVNKDVGFVYHSRDKQSLIDILLTLLKNSSQINERKKNCLKEAKKYEIKNSIKILIEKI